jgi:hypothetical protein
MKLLYVKCGNEIEPNIDDRVFKKYYLAVDPGASPVALFRKS